jgi:DNA polymerase
MKTYAVDFESYYDAECSITTLGPRAYFSHPSFDAYLVTVSGDDGFSFVGHPCDFDWALLTGNRALSHNAAFDESLYLFGVFKGLYPAAAPAEWLCTADMTAYHGLPRSLKDASATLFQIPVDKSVRDNMKGKRWDSMTPEFRKEVCDYALKDAELCLKLWVELGDSWPAHERHISIANRRAGQRGIPIDQALLKSNLESIRTRLFDAEQSIPWINDYTPLSRKAFNATCREQGIEPPVSLAKDNEDTDKWFVDHQESCPWARSVQDFRRINAFLRKLEAFDRGTMADGRYYGGFMYYGAMPTGRFSGSGGNLNLQNLPREEMFGVNFRSMIRPKPGHKLIIADLSQIEVRTLCWLAKDQQTLQVIRESEDIYHAFGVVLGMHDPANGELRKYSKELRSKIKAVTLGCGYGMGIPRFAAENGLSLEDAKVAVDTYRSKMAHVVRYWKTLDRDLALAYSLGVPFELELPTGRKLRYGTIKRMRDVKNGGNFRYLGKLARFGKMRDMSLYGGLLAENCSQGLARDVFSDMLLRVGAAGIPVIMHVHDELICEVPEETAEEALATVLRIMHSPPDWIPDLPVAAEGTINDFYCK